MIKYDHQTTINRDIERVFEYVTDVRNDPAWCPPVRSVEQVAGDGPRKGARYRFRAKPGPKMLEGAIRITGFEPHTRAAYEGENDAMRFRYVYRFEKVGGGTEIHMTSELEPKGLWKLLTPIIRSTTMKTTVEEFERLKTILEEGASGDEMR